MPWVDSHVHVWTADTKRYPRSNNSSAQPQEFTPAEILGLAQASKVERVVLVQMSFYGFDNRYMMDALKNHPGRFSAIAVVNPASPKIHDELRSLAGSGVRGLRVVRPNAPAPWPDDPNMTRLWQIAPQHRIAICPLTNPGALPEIARMCERFPETTVVIDHMARIGVSGAADPRDLDNLCALAKFRNTYVKISAFYALGAKRPPYHDLAPQIRRIRDAFGAAKLMWGSDCPFQILNGNTYEASVALIRDGLDFLSASEKEAILGRTASAVFF